MKLTLILLYLFISPISYSQSSLIGLPQIQNYFPETYNARNQNWDIIQSNEGVMIFANTTGILTYNGKKWQVIKTLKSSVIRSIEKSDSGEIFIGGKEDLGILKLNNQTGYEFQSLRHLLPDSISNFGNVWDILCSNNKTYFLTDNYIFIWDGSSFSHLYSPNFFLSIREGLDGTPWIQIQKQGLFSFDQKLSLISNDPLVLNELLYVFKKQDQQMILGTREKGIFTYQSSGKIKPILSDLNNLLAGKLLYTFTPLSNGWMAFGTSREGLIIADKNGVPLFSLNTALGLCDNSIRSIFQDQEGMLWVATNNGVAKIDISSGLTVLDQRLGLQGTIRSHAFFKNKLFVGTSLGLFQYFPDRLMKFPTEAFEMISDKIGAVWHLEATEKELIISAYQGVFSFNEKIVQILHQGTAYYSYFDSNKQLLLTGHDRKLFITHRQPTKNPEFAEIDLKGDVITIIQEKDSVYWYGSTSQGLTRLTYSSLHTFSLTTFDTTAGLPYGWVLPILYQQKIYAGTTKGLYIFNKSIQRFEPDTGEHGSFFNKNKMDVFRWKENKFMTVQSKNHIYVKYPNEGWKNIPLVYLPIVPYYSLSIDEDKLLMGGTRGLFIYQHQTKLPEAKPFYLHIHNITFSYDSIYHKGIIFPQKPDMIELPKNIRRISFQFAATSFLDEFSNEYQYQLVNADDDWSPFTTENKKEYSNLSPGTYVFNVRAKNAIGNFSEITSLSIYIPSPWYLSWMAWLFYTLLITGLIFLIIHIRTRNIRIEKILLEKEVQHRTEKLSKQSHELSIALANLQQAQTQMIHSEKMAGLGTLVAGIAHEINNPVNFIFSSLDPLKRDFIELDRMMLKFLVSLPMEQKDSFPFDSYNELKSEITLLFKGVETGAVRTSEIVKGLRTFSRLDEHDLKLYDLHDGIETTILLCQHEAKNKITIEKKFGKIAPIFCLPGQINQVVMNLVTNSIHAILPENGTISIETLQENEEEIILKVSDNGKGIKPEHLDKIFDPFFTTKEIGKGTGMGLSISYGIIQAHRGKISVDSSVGKGTIFTIYLPINKAAENVAEI